MSSLPLFAWAWLAVLVACPVVVGWFKWRAAMRRAREIQAHAAERERIARDAFLSALADTKSAEERWRSVRSRFAVRKAASDLVRPPGT